MTAELNGGYLPLSDSESYSFDLIVGGQWRPIKNVGVQIGYRALFFGIETGESDNAFELSEASLQGLYAGVTLSF
jgi:opacity protein-like surface antigen